MVTNTPFRSVFVCYYISNAVPQTNKTMLKFFVVVIFLGWFIWFAYTNFDEAFSRKDGAAAVICADDIGFCTDGSVSSERGDNCWFGECQ